MPVGHLSNPVHGVLESLALFWGKQRHLMLSFNPHHLVGILLDWVGFVINVLDGKLPTFHIHL